jgi:hypothetical protein
MDEKMAIYATRLDLDALQETMKQSLKEAIGLGFKV